MLTSMLALISGEAVLSTIIFLICIGLCFGLVWWLIDYCKVPEPFNRVCRVIVAIGAVIVLIGVLMSLAGHPIISW